MDTEHVPAHQQTANNVPADYEAWRQARWAEIAGPNGKAKVVANGRVTGRDPLVILGVPAQWRITEAGTSTVSAAAADNVAVNGEEVDGTAEVPSGSTLRFSGGHVGFAGGAGGFYGVVVMDHEALARSGLSGIDTYPYDPNWVFEGEYRAAPEGRRQPLLAAPSSCTGPIVA